MSCESDAKSYGLDIFTCALVSSVTVPLCLKQNCVFTLVITSGYTDPHTAHSTHRRQCYWWCAACGRQYDWREAKRVHRRYKARCRLEDTWMVKSHAPPPGACENMISALKPLANLQEKEHASSRLEDMEESNRRNMVAAVGELIEVDNHKAWVSVK